MRILAAALCALFLTTWAAAQKPKKPSDVTVLEAKARRAEGKILVDGRVKTSGVKPIRGLVIYFDLMSAENSVIATEKIVVEEDPLKSGEERTYHAETSDAVRAVRYRIRSGDVAERELRTENPGPFPIE
jgi:hypothetical protein